MRAWVEEQVAAAGYGTTSEYFRQLIREAQRRQVQEEIDRKLLAALDSGRPIEVTPDWWEERRRRLTRRAGARRRQKA